MRERPRPSGDAGVLPLLRIALVAGALPSSTHRRSLHRQRQGVPMAAADDLTAEEVENLARKAGFSMDSEEDK